MVQEYWIWFWGEDLAVIVPILSMGVYGLYLVLRIADRDSFF